MLRKKAPETIPTNLTIKGQGEQTTFRVVYHNRTAEQMDSLFADGAKPALSDVVLYVVAEWETEYPLSTAGLQEAESDRPGFLTSIMEGFHAARRVERVKN